MIRTSYDTDVLVVTKGQGLAISRDRGAKWELYGDSDDEDLSQSAIQEITYDPLSGTVIAIDANGFGYRRALDLDKDEGWELFTFKLPHGEQRRVGVIDWRAVALYLHNGQLVSEHNWWVVNHGFSFMLLLLAATGIGLWVRRKRRRKPVISRVKRWRTVHHVSGLVAWPLLLLLPLTGIMLIHALDVSLLLDAGLPARWFPERFDQNRWKGPVDLYLRAVAISPNNSSRLWVGHTYGLFASEDVGQTWTDVSGSMPGPIAREVEHLVVAPGWLHVLGVGNERGLLLSRDYGTSWMHWLKQPVDALYANNTTLYIASGDTVYWQKYFNRRDRQWSLGLLLCTVWVMIHTTSHANQPVPPPGAVKQFAAAVQTQDMETLLTVFRQIGQQDTKEAVLAIVLCRLVRVGICRSQCGTDPTSPSDGS